MAKGFAIPVSPPAGVAGSPATPVTRAQAATWLLAAIAAAGSP